MSAGPAMRLLALFLLCVVAPPLAAQSSDDLPQSALILEEEVLPDPDSIPDLRPMVAGLGSVGAFAVASPIGYLGADAVFPDNSCSDDICFSESGLLGLALVGTAAGGLVAHWLSRPDDPAWRTILGSVVLQSLYIIAVDQVIRPEEPIAWYLVGVPAVAVVGSTTLAHVGGR